MFVCSRKKYNFVSQLHFEHAFAISVRFVCFHCSPLLYCFGHPPVIACILTTSTMSFLFGKQKTLKGMSCRLWCARRVLTRFAEILREHQRNINRSIREIDRERTALQNQEKKITIEMKKLAKQGQMVRGDTTAIHCSHAM